MNTFIKRTVYIKMLRLKIPECRMFRVFRFHRFFHNSSAKWPTNFTSPLYIGLELYYMK